jgi:hypothetical protein
MKKNCNLANTAVCLLVLVSYYKAFHVTRIALKTVTYRQMKQFLTVCKLLHRPTINLQLFLRLTPSTVHCGDHAEETVHQHCPGSVGNDDLPAFWNKLVRMTYWSLELPASTRCT